MIVSTAVGNPAFFKIRSARVERRSFLDIDFVAKRGQNAAGKGRNDFSVIKMGLFSTEMRVFLLLGIQIK